MSLSFSQPLISLDNQEPIFLVNFSCPGVLEHYEAGQMKSESFVSEKTSTTRNNHGSSEDSDNSDNRTRRSKRSLESGLHGRLVTDTNSGLS